MAQGYICQSCGIDAPTKYVEFYQNIGMIVARQHKAIKGNLCKRCINKHFWPMTLTTLAVGWLGMISLIVAPIFVINNVGRYLFTLGLPAPAPNAGRAQLTDDVAKKLSPYGKEIFERLNAGEKFDNVVQLVSTKANVSPAQVVLFAQAVIQAVKQKQAQQTPGQQR